MRIPLRELSHMVRCEDKEIETERFIAIARHKGQWIAGIVDTETAKKFYRTHPELID